MAKVNYLNKKDLIAEIIKSKNTYSEFLSKEYEFYDVIITDLSEITDEAIQAAKEKKASNMFSDMRAKCKESGMSNYEISKLEKISPSEIKDEDIVFRYMTHEHIPENLERVNKKKSVADYKEKVNFPPFKHIIKTKDGLKEVGRSHWVGGFENGYFSTDHGNMTVKLCAMMKLLVEKYSQKGNFRGYTYNDEMRSKAILQLLTVGLQFNESKSDNPFAYYTRIAQHAFIGVLNEEKKSQNIRDDILIRMGATPSFSRQIEHELEYKQREFNERHNIKKSDVVMIKNVGRPKKKKESN